MLARNFTPSASLLAVLVLGIGCGGETGSAVTAGPGSSNATGGASANAGRASGSGGQGIAGASGGTGSSAAGAAAGGAASGGTASGGGGGVAPGGAGGTAPGGAGGAAPGGAGGTASGGDGGAASGGAGGTVSGGAGGTVSGGAGGVNSGGTSAGGTGGAAGSGGSGGAANTPVRLAFFGDQGNNSRSELALALVKARKADLAVILGDFDYGNDPSAWAGLMSRLKGVPWYGVVGNHDWDNGNPLGTPSGSWPQYQAIIAESVKANPEIKCTGVIGETARCTFRGIELFSSPVYTTDKSDEFQDAEAKRLGAATAASTANAKFCIWHKNNGDFNTGDKGHLLGGEPGGGVKLSVYKACADGGAMVLTGHEHSYERTMTLGCPADPGKQFCPQGKFNEGRLGEGRGLFAVSGLGGKELRDFSNTYHGYDDPWWAAYFNSEAQLAPGGIFTKNSEGDVAGVLFIDVGVDGDPKKGKAFFELAPADPTKATGRIVDSFTIYFP